MKKLFSALLALALVMSTATAAFAVAPAPTPIPYDVQPTIYKTYQINNGTAPAEDFTFSFEGSSYTNGDGDTVETVFPEIPDATIHFDPISQTDRESTELNIDANNYELGVYKYLVTETAGNTAGVTYSTEQFYLVLTIVRDESNNKQFVAAFHYETLDGEKATMGETGYINQYDSGSLTVTKHIAGNMADMSKTFAFTVTFDSGDKDWDTTSVIIDNASGDWSEDGLSYQIELGNSESVTFSNLPAGVTYTVSEDAQNYTSNAVYSDDTHTISADDEDTVDVTNTLTNDIDTGISMDSLPYILMLAAAGIGMVVFFAKKRSHNA